MSFGGHLRAVLFKNWLLWKRELCGSICELVFPIILMMFLFLIKLALKTSDKDAESYLDDKKIVSPYQTYMNLYNEVPAYKETFNISRSDVQDSLPFWWCDKVIKYDWTWGIVYKNNSEKWKIAQYFESEIQQYLDLAKNFTSASKSKFPVKPKHFESSGKLKDYIRDSDYDDSDTRKICFALEIDEFTNKTFKLNIRYNMTSIDPDDTSVYGDFLTVFLTSYTDSVNKYQKKVITQYQKDFIESGFLTVQNLAINRVAKYFDEKAPEVVEIVVPMHGIHYINDPFMSNFGGTLGFFLFVTSLVPVCRMISKIVTEKESKVRESMKMMGLKDTPYWMSWFIMYSIIYTFTSLGCTVVSFLIFDYSNKFVIFLVFFLYGQSCLAFSVLISSIFNKAKTAVLVGMLLFFISYFSLLSVTNTTPKETLSVLSLFNTVAMAEGFIEMMSFEGSQIGITFSNIMDSYYNYSVGKSLIFLTIDTCLYWILALYLDKVIKTETGVSLPWYFPFTISYWKGHSNKEISDEDLALLREEDEKRRREMQQNQNIEDIEPSLQNQIESGQSMKVRGLRKNFGDKTAVDGLDLDMFKGQIFALLGHNGAGKTTTISMLTGMLAPTAGEMTVDNLDFRTDMTQIRKTLGVCPQHDILFKTLTVEEHLYLFCKFKGITNKSEVAELINAKLEDVDLLEKRTTKAGNLSGGQKRKLSLAIALIGGSTIVMLDEPTSGMDLTARRRMWDMLKREKRGRIIILTTHYMEEADILADRIAIMSQGKLYCLGSPLFLKKRFGVGYNLSIVKEVQGSQQPDFSKIEALVQRQIPESRVFNTASAEILFEIPLECSFRFKNFFTELDASMKKLQIETYGISVTTLEEVFIRVSRGDDGGHKRASIDIGKHEKVEKESVGPIDKFDSEILNSDDFNIAEHRIKGIMFFSHFLALIEKRVIYSIRDLKGIVLEICLPIVFVLLGLILLTQFSVYEDQSSRLLSLSHYESKQHVLYYLSNPADKGPLTIMDQKKSKFENIQIKTPDDTLTIKEFDKYIYKKRKVDPFRLGAYYSLNSTRLNTETNSDYLGVYIWGNSSAYASIPTFANEFGQAHINSLRTPGSDFYTFKIYNHPLPLTKKQKNLAQNAGSFYVALIFAIGMAFIPTGLVTFIVKEREHNIKHQHLVSGVSISAYWLSSFVWDLVKYMLPGIVTPLLIKAFDLKALMTPDEVYTAVWYLFILFGFAICPYTYAISFMFKSYSIAQFFIFLLNLIVGVIGGLAVWVLIIINDTTRDVAGVMVYFFRLVSPIFCLSYGLMSVANRDAYQLAYALKDEPKALDWDITGASLFFMALHFVVGTLAVFLIEWLSTVTFFRNLIAARDPGPSDYAPDDDVERMKEEARVADKDEVAVKVSGLRKIYGNLFNKNDTKIAIQEVSFVVPKQQAFALLGVNGAGKTTTFRILTGEYGPTVGEAYISGYNVVTDLSSARYNIGYCPQFDALSEVLTPVEHLKLYAKIKGIPKHLIKTFVDKQIADMGLGKYVKVRAGNLSGGNKRKLSVAIATIGNPPVVFLDEPSAGMDPNARKNMWEVVNRIKRQKCSIILTTHSMDEAESLCNTMAIMVNGRFKCYGTATHIKNKYSSGYEFLLKVKYPTAEDINILKNFMHHYINEGYIGEHNVKLALAAATVEDLHESIAEHESGAHLHEELKENKKIDVNSLAEWIILEKIGINISQWLEKEFRNIRLIEHYGSYYKFKLEKREDITIGGLFGKIEDAKEGLKIEEYSLSQTTLEQIFNMFATEGEGNKLRQRLSGSQFKADKV